MSLLNWYKMVLHWILIIGGYLRICEYFCVFATCCTQQFSVKNHCCFNIKTPLFLCLWIYKTPPNSGGNMQEPDDLWRLSNSGWIMPAWLSPFSYSKLDFFTLNFSNTLSVGTSLNWFITYCPLFGASLLYETTITTHCQFSVRIRCHKARHICLEPIFDCWEIPLYAGLIMVNRLHILDVYHTLTMWGSWHALS